MNDRMMFLQAYKLSQKSWDAIAKELRMVEEVFSAEIRKKIRLEILKMKR